MIRKLIRFSEDIINQCYNPQEFLDEILGRAEKGIFNLVSYHGVDYFISIKQRVLKVLEHLNAVAKSKGDVTGIPTGFHELDYKFSGLQASDLIIIAARPSMGKTAFALNIAQHICFKENLCVAIFSLEMNGEQLINRLLSMQSGVNAQAIRNESMNDHEWMGIVESADAIAKSKLIIDDTTNISISELRSKCQKYRREEGLSVVIIDYLQLMKGRGRNESRQEEISGISRSLKALARELNVPVIALSQLNRQSTKREDYKPMMSDLRDSGAIEQDADVIMFLHRDEYYTKEKSEMKGITEVLIAKQRNGPIGTVELVWLEKYTRFANKEFERNTH